MPRNLATEKLVWLPMKEFGQIVRAVNLAALMASEAVERGITFHDLDGDEVTPERLADGVEAINRAHDATQTAKFVPEHLVNKLQLILLSD